MSGGGMAGQSGAEGAQEIEHDRRAERRLIPQALVALACVVVLVVVREWLLA